MNFPNNDTSFKATIPNYTDNMKSNIQYKIRCKQLRLIGMEDMPNNTLEIGTPDGFYYYSLPCVEYYAAISYSDIREMSAENWAVKISEIKLQIIDMDKQQEEHENG
jgi:hypothetical protein